MPVKALKIFTLDDYYKLIEEKLEKRVVHTLMYGNPEWQPMQFTGFVPRWEDDDAPALP